MNRRPPSLKCILGCVTTLLIASCSSHKKGGEASGATVSGLNRFMDKGFDRKNGEFDKSIISKFDQRNYAAGSKIKEQKFHTGSFAGKQDYNGLSGYKSKEFKQSGQMSTEGKGVFSESSKTSQVGDKSFATKDSREGGHDAMQGGKSFAGGDKSYTTSEVRDAAKSQKKNVKPNIIAKDDEMGKTAYSEADVKRMVNRN